MAKSQNQRAFKIYKWAVSALCTKMPDWCQFDLEKSWAEEQLCWGL